MADRDDTRHLLAEAVQGHPVNVVQRGPLVFVNVTGPMTADTAYDLVDGRLLPVVARLVAEGQARALREAADEFRYTPLSEREAGAPSEFTQGWHAAAQSLDDRAAALHTEDTP